MEMSELQQILQQSGVVGAGGAGFPTYAKLNASADTILLNCAECEPLLKLHRQLMEEHVDEILQAFHLYAEVVGASDAVICIKQSYRDAVRAIRERIDAYPEMRVKLLPDVYPMGDEVVTIYEATGRAVRPGGLPIEVGCIVQNVETIYNMYRAVWRHEGVTDKLISVVADVAHPVTVRVPLGVTLDEVVALAGGSTIQDPVYFVGGPMMGRILPGDSRVTKTTNAILVLPADHKVVMMKHRKPSIDLARAASICCQCEACTDMCPRHLLGHPIDPARFMRSAPNADFQDLSPYLDTFFCSQCGVCEMYACPQDLSPRTLIGVYKTGLRQKGVKPPQVAAKPVQPARAFRKLPEERLMHRLGLASFDVDAPLADAVVPARSVRVLLSQHIGAPAQPIVKKGDAVQTGQMIAAPGKGLSVGIHASIDGVVSEVTDSYIGIVKGQVAR